MGVLGLCLSLVALAAGKEWKEPYSADELKLYLDKMGPQTTALVVFYSPKCKKSKLLLEKVDELLTRYDGAKNPTFVKVDADLWYNTELKAYGVEAVPAAIYYDHQSEMDKTFEEMPSDCWDKEGKPAYEKIQSWVDKLTGAFDDPSGPTPTPDTKPKRTKRDILAKKKAKEEAKANGAPEPAPGSPEALQEAQEAKEEAEVQEKEKARGANAGCAISSDVFNKPDIVIPPNLPPCKFNQTNDTYVGGTYGAKWVKPPKDFEPATANRLVAQKSGK